MTSRRGPQETSRIGHRLLRPRAAGAALLTVASILAAALPAHAAVYVYNNDAVGTTTIPETTVANCISGGRQVNFTVPDTFNVTVGTGTVSVGLVLTHDDREQVHAILRAPNLDTATVLTGVDNAVDSPDNYDVVISTYNLGAINDGDLDPTAAPNYNRLAYTGSAATFNNFSGDPANGTWTLFLCDIDNDGPLGNVVSARLTLNDALAGGEVCSEKATYNWCAAGCDGTVFPGGGATVTADVGLFLQGSSALGGADNGGWDLYTPSFARQTEQLGADTGFYLAGGMNITGAGANAEAAAMLSTWDFRRAGVAIQVSGLSWTALDVDFSTAANSFRDLMRADGFTGAAAAGTPMPYVQTLQGCNAAAGDVVLGTCEIVHGSPGSSGANPTRRFLRGVASVAFGYTASEDVAPDIQYVGISDPSFCVYDFGDAPDTYGTNTNTTAARHVLGQRSLYLGALPPDGELSGRANATATGDNATAPLLLADEDGVASFPNYTAGSTTYTVSVNATNTSGLPAFLYGYIDWNRDGDFADANERSQVVNVANGSFTGAFAPEATNFNVTWTSVPSNAGGTAATFARFRISSNNTAVQSPTGFAPDGEVEDYQISSGTLPVTIAHVETVPSGNSLHVRFTTASESANAGFRIWGTSARGKTSLLATVKSQGSDSFAPLDYETTVQGLGIQSIEIEDLSAFGRNRLHGPFAVGSTFGEEPEAARIDWAAIKAEAGLVTALDRVAAAESGDLERIAGLAASLAAESSGLLLVRHEGIHRVTYEELAAAGVELAGVEAGRIALLDNGVPMPRFVSTASGVFGPGGAIEFVARPQLTLASPVDAYVLKVDAKRAVPVYGSSAGQGAAGETAAFDSYRPDREYSSASPNGDPWIDAKALAWGAPASLSRTFDLPDLARGPVRLKVRVWGYGDFEGAAPDHHVVVKVNGTEVAQSRFDGLTAWEPEIDITGLAAESGNTLEIHVPGDTGYSWDYIALEGFDLAYSRATTARDGRFQGTMARRRAFAVAGFEPGESIAIWKAADAAWTRDEQVAVNGAVTLPGGTGDAYAAAPGALHRPGIAAGVPAAQRSTAAGTEYVIVTHPVFAGTDAVADLVALEESRGFVTEVVTVDAIFAAYSDHASSAAALKSFLSASLRNGNLRYVLLVGADTTDPYDHLGAGSVSYVPTEYLDFAQYVRFSPTDEGLVDRANDGLGDVPVGRLPVRTAAELDAVVEKLVAWEQRIGQGRPTALMTAGASDSARWLADLNESYAGELEGWQSQLAAVDDLNAAAVRQRLLAAVNAGTDLVSYVGHSSMGQWDFTPILKWQDAPGLTNHLSPNLFTAWGCWNSYYVEPTIESLSARMLRELGVGAAGMIGATTLTTESSHRQLGQLFFARVNAGAATVGEAFRGAKQDLQLEGGAIDAIYGMTLLGDPAMSLPQPQP